MKSYIIITGIIFVLLFIAHVARVVVEGSHPLTDIFAYDFCVSWHGHLGNLPLQKNHS